MKLSELFQNKPVVKLHTVIKISNNYFLLCKIAGNNVHFVSLDNPVLRIGTPILDIEEYISDSYEFSERELRLLLEVCYNDAEYVGQLKDVYTRKE